MATLTTSTEVIQALGGIAKVGRMLQTSSQAVWNWKTRGLPPETYLVLTEALKEAGHDAPPSLWRQIPVSREAAKAG